ncbi:MAG: transcriptional regulator, partial [Proteobacteria bacterium]
MLILETLEAHGTLRFTELGHKVGDISQKMLTKTLRQMEADGLVTRKVHPVVPPHVDYALTDLGRGLGAAFCSVWIWAETHYDDIEQSRAAFAARQGAQVDGGHQRDARNDSIQHGRARRADLIDQPRQQRRD